MKHWMILVSALALSACQQQTGQAAPKPEARAETESVTVTDYATGLEQPWGMAFLPDGQLLVTEKAGRLQRVNKAGQLTEIMGVPPVFDVGQGGLLDVAVDPQFVTNSFIYLSFSEPEAGDQAGTAVARARLVGDKLEDLKVIWRQTPKVRSGHHWGSRLVFARDGTLFVTTGDRGGQRNRAQDLSSTIGKVIRINTDGTIPSDNPFVGQAGVPPEIWSYGHRNMQGAALHPVTGELWTHEHGAKGGDEINKTLAGKNYGWPVITWGVDYSGLPIGEGRTKPGMEQPLHYWDPSIAPSGMVFYTGDAFKSWKGSVLIGALKLQYLSRLTLEGDKVVAETKLLEDMEERVRDVEQGPDGLIYVAFDNADGRIVRLSPGTK